MQLLIFQAPPQPLPFRHASNNTHSQPEQTSRARRRRRRLDGEVRSSARAGGRARWHARSLALSRIHPRFKFKHFEGRGGGGGGIGGAPKDDGWSCGLAGGNHEGKGHAFQGGAKEALMRYASCEETILLLLWVLANNAPCLGVRAWWQHLYPAAEALRTLLTKGGGAGVLYVHAVLSCCGI